MDILAHAYLLSLTLVTLLSLLGFAPYRDEFRSWPRRLAALGLWLSILAVVVCFPLASGGRHELDEPVAPALPALFVGHALMSAFLLAWWALRGDQRFLDFLHLRWTPELLRSRLLLGVFAGLAGWVITIAATGVVAGLWVETSGALPPTQVPPVLAWIANLSFGQKAAIVFVAMTVEEAFFRGFLQPRLGLLGASVCFALSHFNYGLPFLVVGVFVVSLFLGWLFQRTGHLLPCIVAHGVFDAVQLFLVLPWAVRQVL